MTRTLSIIIPAYNESSFIIRCLESVVAVELDGWKKEIIVIDDGSQDETSSLVTNYQKKHSSVQLIALERNKGKGFALQQGIAQATGDVCIIQDADLEYDPHDYIAILAQYDDQKTQVVYGSRVLGSNLYHSGTAGLVFYLGGRTLTQIVNIAFGATLSDQPTCYKSWRGSLSAELLKYCKSTRFEFEIELTAFFTTQTRIREVPIHYAPRTIEQGKKIGYKDFITSVLTIARCVFTREMRA